VVDWVLRRGLLKYRASRSSLSVSAVFLSCALLFHWIGPVCGDYDFIGSLLIVRDEMLRGGLLLIMLLTAALMSIQQSKTLLKLRRDRVGWWVFWRVSLLVFVWSVFVLLSRSLFWGVFRRFYSFFQSLSGLDGGVRSESPTAHREAETAKAHRG